MITVFAEKPSVGREYAEILGATNAKDGYIEGNGYTVTWGFGHLVSLADAQQYDPKYKSWYMQDLPIIPERFKLAVTEKKQFMVIKDLFSKCDYIINGGDAGREGELIFRYIYSLTGCKKPVKRLWISSLTPEAIEKGFQHLKPGSDFDNLYHAGKARGEGDWLLGINASRALTLGAEAPVPLSLGRVQTPVLAMIAGRYLDNKNFSPSDYFVPQLKLTKGDVPFLVNYKGRFEKRTEAEHLLSLIPDAITCTKALRKEKKETQPLLFDLTSLQREANKKLQFSAQKTLDLMQGLYEKHKVLTYPRTDSRYITSDIFVGLESLFQAIKEIPEYCVFIDALELTDLPKKSVNDAKVTDHHAIIPTGKISKDLSQDEALIFDMVTRQFIAAFSPLCIKDTVSLEFQEGEALFIASGSAIKTPGWRTLFGATPDEEEEQEENQILPFVETGESVPVSEKQALSKKTKAPPVYSEATILEAMETAGKALDDEQAREAMKECGLGRPATRAGILETLLKRGFIMRSNNKLLPTELGEAVYNSVKNFDFASPEMTGQWEKKLNLMAEGSYSPSEFRKEIEAFTRKSVHDIESVAQDIKFKSYECPKCQARIKLGKRGHYCSNVKIEEQIIQGEAKRVNVGCTFSIPYVLAGKAITKTLFEELIARKRTAKKITGFKKKDGSGTFDAFLILTEDFKLGFDFSLESLGTCPKCKTGEVVERKVHFGCSNARFEDLDNGTKKNVGCDFTVWKKISEKNVSPNAVKLLISKGKSGLIKGFKKKANDEKFDAMLTLKEDFSVGFEFPKRRKKKAE